MPAYAIFDVEIRDPTRYQEFMAGVKPALDKLVPSILREAARTKFTRETGSLAGL
jgi:uncharacterized protein (DUF1330 family)